MSRPAPSDLPEAESSDFTTTTPEAQIDSLVDNLTDVTGDGRVNIDFDANSRLSRTLSRIAIIAKDSPTPLQTSTLTPHIEVKPWITKLNIVIQVVGSRGDVQPFVALGCALQKHGHRIRIATHATFKQFVQSSGLEFFSIGGNPVELMAYMVKNPGLIPKLDTVRQGEIQKKRRMIRDMVEGCWESCLTADPDTKEPFVANAIIANPVSFAHLHCAQALAIPVHIMFTMPWTATKAFPHPLTDIKNSSVSPELANYMSYKLAQVLTWQGIADIINDWRKTIGLDAVPLSEGPFLSESLKIPHTYCWSPSLVPKPDDWPPYIDICGFFFRQPPLYTPHDELAAFLAQGDPPVYIGFGSIVLENPGIVTEAIMDAVRSCKVRAIVSPGWSGISQLSESDSVFFLSGDCPHEWLFQRVAAVVHHGGAGTTACGLLNGRPTAIVPFFGDQPFWGEMIAAAGAGPRPILGKDLNATALSEAILFCLRPETTAAANAIADKMKLENGIENAVASFHAHLPSDKIACEILPQFPAVWYHKRTLEGEGTRLSTIAAQILTKNDQLKWKHIKRCQPCPLEIVHQRWDPITAFHSMLFGAVYDIATAANTVWKAPRDVRRKGKRSEQSEQSGSDRAKQSAAMVGASAMSVPRVGAVFFRWALVDMTLAVAEGFRAVPRLYGESVPDIDPVTGILSGGKAAGKNFYRSIGSGLSGLATHPAEGMREGGAVGLATGVGRAALTAVANTASGCVGLYAYTAQGVYKSAFAATHSGPSRDVRKAQQAQDRRALSNDEYEVFEAEVLETFNRLHPTQLSETSQK